MDTKTVITAGLVAFTGIAVAGLLNNAFIEAGYETLGTLAWVAGFAAVVFYFWFRFVRDLNPTGP